MLNRRVLICALAALPAMARAQPRRYRLDPATSTVRFSFLLAGAAQSGEMPVTRADLWVDPADLASSRADVTLNPAAARTDLFLATQALKGPGVLDVARFPEIRFVSTRVQLAPSGRLSDGARLFGDLTIRDRTRPIALDAGLFRLPGSAPDDLDTLIIQLSGSLSRSAFGATAYPELVGDTVAVAISATVRTE